MQSVRRRELLGRFLKFEFTKRGKDVGLISLSYYFATRIDLYSLPDADTWRQSAYFGNKINVFDLF